MFRHRLSRWQKAVVVAMTVWGMAIIAPDTLRPFRHYGTLGFAADNNGRIVQVDDKRHTQPAGCLQANDWIEMTPTPAPQPDLLAVFGGMGGMQYVRDNQVVKLSIAHTRDGPAHPCSVFAVPLSGAKATLWPHFRTLAFWAPILIADVLGLLFIYGCARIVWQCPGPAAWGFFLYGLWFNPGQYFAAYAELQRWPAWLVLQEGLQALFQSAGYVGFIVFALTFPDHPVSPGWRPLYRSLPVLGVVLAVLQLASFASAFGIRSETVTDWSYYAGMAVDVGVWVILRQRYRAMDPIDRQRTRWVLWGCAFGLTVFIFADINEATSLLSPLWTPQENLLACFYILSCTVAATVYFAIRNYRVFDVHFWITRWAVNVTVLVALGTALLVAEVILHDHLDVVASKIGIRHSGQIALLPLAVGLTVGAEKLRDKLLEDCNRLFFRQLYETKEHLEDIKAEFAKVGDFDPVDTLLTQEPVKWLGVSSAAVFRRADGDVYRRQVPAVGWPDGTAMEIQGDLAVVRLLLETQRPLRFEDEQQLPVAKPAGVAQPVLAIPVCNAEELVAIALYGAHREGDTILREETLLLKAMAEAAAGGYARAEARRLRQELERVWHGQGPSGAPA